MTSSTNCNSSGGLTTSKKNSVAFARLLSVSSKVIPAITSPPCTKHEEDDVENDVDNDDVNKFIHKLDI